jgi:diguanylate cyclase (GGDEF)-like protein/PAS domain S-box-containing protein
MNGIGTASGRRFFSLKWKALLLTSLVLLAVTAFVSAVSYLHLLRQFEDQRDRSQRELVHQIGAQIEGSAQRLRKIGAFVPLLEGMQDALREADAAAIAEAFDRHWPMLQLEMGVAIARIYDDDTTLLVSRSDGEPEATVVRQAESLVRRANAVERPLSAVICTRSDCRQYGAVPMLIDGRRAGVVLIGTSLADIVLGFKHVSGSDIGLLISRPGDGRNASVLRGRYVAPWQARVVALTNAARNGVLIHKAAAAHPHLEEAGIEVQVHHDRRIFGVTLIPLEKAFEVGARGAFMAIISDTTEMVEDIRSAAREVAMVGVAGLLVAETLLLIILWTPMSRLRQMSLELPLLARSKFRELRTALRQAGREGGYLEDEIDVLSSTAVALSRQLEALQSRVAEHTGALADRAQELIRERNFVASLLNTAQVIVLTQDSEGLITMSNRYAESLTGYTAGQLRGAPYLNLIEPGHDAAQARRALAEVVSGRREHLRHEAKLICREGSTREIAWYHSQLRSPGESSVTVLSAGLDVTDRRAAESRLSWLADHDALTGLYNRRRFQEELRRALEVAQRYRHAGALLYLDLDQFKDVNDSSGHQAGDMLLAGVARTLTRVLRSVDTVGRLGGDEFGILIRETDARSAVETAKKVLRELATLELAEPAGLHRVSASVGIARFPSHGRNVRDLLANADLAMYQAKEAGRGRWHLFSNEGEMRRKLQLRVHWKARVEEALAKGWFVLHLQPMLDVRRGTVDGYEILLRMSDAASGRAIPAAQFIGVAERTGLIRAIDRTVLLKAIPQLAELMKRGHDVRFSINLSAFAFEDPELLPLLQSVLQRTGVDPSHLLFEITETAALAEFGAARKLIQSVKSLGCRFALDDFGVGFSSLFYLKQLPVDQVKIDGSFIRHLHASSDDQLLVKAIGEVARGFGKETVAEFVESEETLAVLRKYQIDYAQGHFIGRARPVGEVFPEVPERVAAAPSEKGSAS